MVREREKIEKEKERERNGERVSRVSPAIETGERETMVVPQNRSFRESGEERVRFKKETYCIVSYKKKRDFSSYSSDS